MRLPAPLPLLAFALVFGLVTWPDLQPPLAPLLLGIAAIAGLILIAERCVPADTTGTDEDADPEDAEIRAGSKIAGQVGIVAIGLLLGWAIPARHLEPPALRGEWAVAGIVAGYGGKEAVIEAEAAAPQGGAWSPLHGRILVRFPTQAPPLGSRVVARGRAAPVDPTHLPHSPDPIRRALRAGYRTTLSAREVAAPPGPRIELDTTDLQNPGLLRALIDGQRDGIPPEIVARMRRTGTTHLLSISGLHIGLAALGCAAVGWLIGRPIALFWWRGGLHWISAAAAVAGAALYADVAGWPVPAARAVWATSAAALLSALHLRPDPAALLSLALAAVLTADPDALHSLSAQLSFGAMAGMLLIPPRITRLLPLDTPRWITTPVTSLAAGIGATAGTFPATTYHFQEFPPLSTLANLWAVPLIGSLATPALLLSQIAPAPLDRWLLLLSDRACTFGLWGLQFFDIDPWRPAVTLAGALALAAALLLRRSPLAALALAALALYPGGPPARLQVVFFSIGQGDAALIRWPDGRDWLIDGGPPGRALLAELRRRGVRRLDRILLSHPHPDHLGGLLPVAEELPVTALIAPLPPDADLRSDDGGDLKSGNGGDLRSGNTSDSKSGIDANDQTDDYTRLVSLIPDARFGLAAAEPGLEVLHPAPGFVGPRDPVNDQSLVARLSYGAHRFLFPGDIEAAGEAALTALAAAGVDLRADVLKSPHHGSRTSSSIDFIRLVQPSWVVISCGLDNRYRHPSPIVLARYAGIVDGAGDGSAALAPIEALRTDRRGTVVIESDGARLSVRYEGAPWLDAW